MEKGENITACELNPNLKDDDAHVALSWPPVFLPEASSAPDFWWTLPPSAGNLWSAPASAASGGIECEEWLKGRHRPINTNIHSKPMSMEPMSLNSVRYLLTLRYILTQILFCIRLLEKTMQNTLRIEHVSWMIKGQHSGVSVPYPVVICWQHLVPLSSSFSYQLW